MIGITKRAELISAVQKGGAIAMNIYARDFDVYEKDDATPVTEADVAVDSVLLSALENSFPDVPVVTEERSTNRVADMGDQTFFLVDPIDGTKEFVKKTGQFTINVALIKNRIPVFGIVYAPAIDRMFIGAAQATELSNGAEKLITVSSCPGRMRAVASRSHCNTRTEAFLDAHEISDKVSAGSSLKFCLVACGEADVYPRLGPTMEWDTAAGQAVLIAAGGTVLLESGAPLLYAKPEFRNPSFIACSPEARIRCGLAQ